MLLEHLGPNAPGTCGSDGTCVQQQEVSAAGPASNRHEKRHRQQQTQRSRHKQQHKQQQQQQIAPQLRHFVCVANYGFLGDVMELSERLRWMGPVRCAQIDEFSQLLTSLMHFYVIAAHLPQ